MLLALLRELSWPELRHHPWRHAAALVAIALGVALAYSVHLVNRSALSEFSAAVRAVNGEPDLEVGGPRDGFDEAVYERIALHPSVAVASPVVEADTAAIDASGGRVAVRAVGIDALVVAAVAPALRPQPATAADRFALLRPDAVFLNAAARERLGVAAGEPLRLQVPGGTTRTFTVAGGVAAGGPPLAVLDIAGAQEAFARRGRVTRVDVRLVAGSDAAAAIRAFALPEGVRAAAPGAGNERVSNVSRAYRVNLTVLALVAMFTGAFLVFSILSLSVAQRTPHLALLGVLGASARERLGLVLAESALLGVAGSLAGLALGAALAALALRLVGGDLGGGYFPGVSPTLAPDVAGTLVYGALGIAAAVVGGLLPARAAARLEPAAALKGLGTASTGDRSLALGAAAIAAGALLALAPPIAGLPLAAYVSVALLLVGGIACVPGVVALGLGRVRVPRHPLALLAVERARHERATATVAVAGVVAALALSVALTVMVTSFRIAVGDWLDAVLPADLYARMAVAGSSGATGSDATTLPEGLVERAARLPGVASAEGQRVVSLPLRADRPPVALIARRLDDPSASLPLTGELVPAMAGEPSIYVSEAMVDLHGARPGGILVLPLPDGRPQRFRVRGVWRDYARQFGAVAIDTGDWRSLTGDTRTTDLALRLAPGADADAVQRGLRAAVGAAGGDGALLEIASARDIRALSLRIFDRSFAVTRWLQAVAIAIGLFGVAASWSAQVLARRREFGLLAHLGVTRRQVLAVVAGESFVWTLAGCVLGVVLGLAVSVVLVHVVNPQSFHWTMRLVVPWPPLLGLAAVVLAAATLTAAAAARGAVRGEATRAVREDW